MRLPLTLPSVWEDVTVGLPPPLSVAPTCSISLSPCDASPSEDASSACLKLCTKDTFTPTILAIAAPQQPSRVTFSPHTDPFSARTSVGSSQELMNMIRLIRLPSCCVHRSFFMRVRAESIGRADRYPGL
ncbi:hypothetical protein KIPB_013874 [Kipferlia bialata]|uniref:Uncharacterized protein n=1 Tax=Kipferlia bialata TaxID=797122 RepID=A0A391P9G6_9EUKA|nr:hypothetical protein KIPB_013874 [Kipferlia bialata]|eukprot:g13874.t1